MTTTWTVAKTPRTVAAARAQLLAALDGAPTAGWSANAPQLRLVDDFATRLVEESEIRADLARYLDVHELASADDSWGDAFATIFDEERIPALQAVWDIVFAVTPAAAPLTISPSTVLQLQDGAGLIAESIQAVPVTLSATSAPTPYQGTVRVRVRTAGTVGNTVTAGKIIRGPAGLSFAPVPPTPVTAGRDAETNLELVRRCLGKWPRRGAGWTDEAFDYLIPTAAPTVTRWRVRGDNPFGPGTTGVVIANASGPALTAERDAVDAYLNSRSVRSNGSGRAVVNAAALDALTINLTIEGDGSNASLGTDAQTAVLALCGAMPNGPATLDDGVVRAVALGGKFNEITIDVGGGEKKKIYPPLPGFTGAESIVACSLVAPHLIPLDGVLVATVNVTVV